MKRYCAILAATVVAVPLVVGMLFLMAAGQVSPKYYWVETLMARKNAAALAAPGPKVALIGGSNVLFGLRAGEVGRALGMPAVNLGIHGGLGPDYTLYEARKALRPGDVAVMAMEYTHYSDDTDGINKMVAGVSLSRGLDYFLHLPWDVRARYLRHLPLDRLANKALGRFVAWKQRGGDTYKADTVDANGDETADASTDASRAKLAREMGRPRGAPVFLPRGRGVAAMRSFIRWCRERDVTVLATWPNTCALPAFRGEAYERFEAAVRAFYAELGVPMLGDPAESQLPPELMYDTIYHPNDRGRELRTARFIAHLKAALDKG